MRYANVFPPLVPLLLASVLLCDAAHAEDAEHRADRLRTKALNEHAGAVVKRRDASTTSRLSRHDRDVDAYQRAMADWRRRVAACRAGDYDACENR